MHLGEIHLNKALFYFVLFSCGLGIIGSQQVFATTCVESITCLPTTPVDVLKIWDMQIGQGTSLIMLALILGSIEMAIYLRTRSLAMLSVLALYSVAAFASILTSPYFASQYHYLVYVVIFSVTSVAVMAIFKLVKE